MENNTFESQIDIYNQYDFTTETDFMNNRLFATFTQQNLIEGLINELSSTYNIMYKKIFVLFVKSTNEYVVTYNIEQGNINTIPENTILVHRKKEFNVLYSINSLNELIKSENNGIVDKNFPINWNKYQNSILLTQHGEFKQLNTKIYKIVDL
jgi:hypothetical protein